MHIGLWNGLGVVPLLFSTLAWVTNLLIPYNIAFNGD